MRIERVNALLQQLIMEVLQRKTRDPRLGKVVVTGVKTAADLGHAVVYWSQIGTPAERTAAQAGLDRAAPFIQGVVGDSIKLHATPRLKFIWDESIEHAQRIEQLIRQGRPESAPAAGGAAA